MKHTTLARWTPFLLTLMLAAATFPASQTALAQSTGGTLTASGDGLAGIRGNGTVILSGSGILWVRDQAGDASIEISGNGVKRELEDGWVRYAGFQGQAVVSGSAITVALSGYDIELKASGTGSYVLRGNGTYTIVKDGWEVEGEWTESAEEIPVP
jgi:hypothetical protein